MPQRIALVAAALVAPVPALAIVDGWADYSEYPLLGIFLGVVWWGLRYMREERKAYMDDLAEVRQKLVDELEKRDKDMREVVGLYHEDARLNREIFGQVLAELKRQERAA